MKKFKKVFALMLALACIFSLSITAFADDATIDYSKTGTLNIYKYDMTSAAEDGAWTSGSFVASGELNQSIISAMAASYKIGYILSILRKYSVCKFFYMELLINYKVDKYFEEEIFIGTMDEYEEFRKELFEKFKKEVSGTSFEL